MRDIIDLVENPLHDPGLHQGSGTMATIYLLHGHFSPEHLEHVIAEMRRLGPPTIRTIEVADNLFALEGCHRLRAAEKIGMPVHLDPIGPDETVDTRALDIDTMGHFDDPAAVPALDLWDWLFGNDPSPTAVTVERA